MRGRKSSSDIKQAAIHVISIPERIRYQYLNLIKTAMSEILLVFPTVNAVQREHAIGVMDELKNAVLRGVKIRILSAEDDYIKGKLDILRASGVVVRRIETPTEQKFKMLIVDRKTSLIVETKDDSKSQFREAVGLGILSNSNATVMPSVTIFESFWRETDLYEKARESDRIKDEFVNIAAHELRNPIMPIISGAELLSDNIKLHKDHLGDALYSELSSEALMIVRNAMRLLKLSEDILQVSRIDSGTFDLHLEAVDLDSLIQNAIADVEKSHSGQKPNVMIVFASNLGLDKSRQRSPFKTYCDPAKLSQTLFNLIDNAFRFTEEGQILVGARIYDDEIIIHVRDPGYGIDPEIRSRLFEKFVSKSNGGTGLGLYLSKKIMEAHGGRIWVEDNRNASGTTFYLAFPLDLRHLGSDAATRKKVMHSGVRET